MTIYTMWGVKGKKKSVRDYLAGGFEKLRRKKSFSFALSRMINKKRGGRITIYLFVKKDEAVLPAFKRQWGAISKARRRREFFLALKKEETRCSMRGRPLASGLSEEKRTRSAAFEKTERNTMKGVSISFEMGKP